MPSLDVCSLPTLLPVLHRQAKMTQEIARTTEDAEKVREGWRGREGGQENVQEGGRRGQDKVQEGWGGGGAVDQSGIF